MAKNKKPRTAQYNHNQAQLRQLRRDTRQCRLYRWEKEDNSSGSFDVYGPFDKAKNMAIMEKATSRTEKWLLVVTAHFLTDKGDYYEEMLTFPVFGPFRLKDNIGEIMDVVNAAVVEARESGDPDHYQDTCSVLYPYSKQLEARLENDDWVMEQAGIRADLVLKEKANG